MKEFKDLFRMNYRVGSPRLPYRDYRANGRYYLTLCTQGRVHYFGEIISGIMYESVLGRVVHENIEQIHIHFPRIHIDTFVVMPNHIHMIMVIDNQKNARNGDGNADSVGNEGSVGNAGSVETCHGMSLREPKPKRAFEPKRKNKYKRENTKFPLRSFGKPIAGSLGVIINQYKGSVTRLIRQNFGGIKFARQSGYYEHIIRNEDALYRIQQYIHNNPKSWK